MEKPLFDALVKLGQACTGLSDDEMKAALALRGLVDPDLTPDARPAPLVKKP